MIPTEPGDRVLLLSIPTAEEVREVAQSLSGGIVVCLAGPERLYDLRRDVRDLENVLVAPADSEGSIPWKDEFFSVVVAQDLAEPSAEMLRVLSASGVMHLSGGPITKR